MRARNNLIGKKFGRLTVVDYAEDNVSASGYHTVMWKCVCECGKFVVVRGKCLTSGVTKSCGCFQKSSMSSRVSKHHKSGTRLYAIWNSMRQRCNNPRNRAYHNYGGRGITICHEWDSFEEFQRWAYFTGYDEAAERGKCTLDRVDVNGMYSPDNCRWSDMREQSNNKRNTIYIEYQAQEKPISQWADETGLDYSTIWKRHKLELPTTKVLQSTRRT